MKRYIYAQSMSLGDIERLIKHHVTEIEINFIMLILGPHVLTRHHWIQEIYAQLHDVPTTKSSHDFPTKKQLFKWMYTDNVYDFINPKKFKKLLKAISEKEKELPKPDNVDALMSQTLNLLESYFDWLSSELSDSGYATLDEIESFINTLF